MNTLLAFFPLLFGLRIVLFPPLARSSGPYPHPILLGTLEKFLNRPNHGLRRRSGGRSDQPHILGRSPIGSSALSLSVRPPPALLPS